MEVPLLSSHHYQQMLDYSWCYIGLPDAYRTSPIFWPRETTTHPPARFRMGWLVPVHRFPFASLWERDWRNMARDFHLTGGNCWTYTACPGHRRYKSNKVSWFKLVPHEVASLSVFLRGRVWWRWCTSMISERVMNLIVVCFWRWITCPQCFLWKIQRNQFRYHVWWHVCSTCVDVQKWLWYFPWLWLETHTVEVPLVYRSESNCLQKHICITHVFWSTLLGFLLFLLPQASLFGSFWYGKGTFFRVAVSSHLTHHSRKEPPKKAPKVPTQRPHHEHK